MVRERRSRRSLLSTVGAAAVGLSGLAGCLGEGECRLVFDGVEAVRGGEDLQYEADVSTDERLYVECRRREGTEPTLTVFDPAAEPVVSVDVTERFERVIEPTESGTFAVVLRNESTGTTGQWALTIAAYRGWCGEIY